MMLSFMMSQLRPCYFGQKTKSITVFHMQSFHSTNTTSLRHRSHTYYYDVLEVTPKSTHKQIKSAFYRLSKIHHPDSSPSSSAEKFHEISEAYEVLGNNFTRKKYDRGLLNPTDPRSGHHASNETDDRSFQSRRFKGRGPIVTGKTKYYDFDEYYKQHYGEQVLQEFKKKQQASRPSEYGDTARLDDEKHSKRIRHELHNLKTERLLLFISVGLILLLMTFLHDSGIVRELESTTSVKDKSNVASTKYSERR